MLFVVYTEINDQLTPAVFRACLEHMPPDVAERAGKYKHFQSACQFLLGRMLLKYCFKNFFEDDNILTHIRYSKYGKPYFEYYDKIWFNLSHAGNMVVCVMSDDVCVGVDIEQRVSFPYAELLSGFCEMEVQQIERSSCPDTKSLELWARKEACIKADGRGINLTLNELNVLGDTIAIGDQIWYFSEVSIARDYVCYIVTSKKMACEKVSVERVVFFG